MALYLNHLCRNFLYQLLGSLLDDASPKIGVLKFRNRDVVLELLVELNGSPVIDALAIAIDYLFPIPSIGILLQEFIGHGDVTINREAVPVPLVFENLDIVFCEYTLICTCRELIPVNFLLERVNHRDSPADVPIF